MRFLEQLQRSVELHLTKQEAFLNVPVISRNFESRLNEFVQSGVGLCIVVLNPIPIRIIPGKECIFEDIQLRVQIIESAGTNNALSLAEEISQCLHHFQPPLSGWKGWLTLTEWKEIKDKHYILELNFQVRGSAT